MSSSVPPGALHLSKGLVVVVKDAAGLLVQALEQTGVSRKRFTLYFKIIAGL